MVAIKPDQHAGVRGRWAAGAGYAACAWGLVFGLISIYWGCGGTLGLNTIGGTIERLALAHSAGMFAAVWVTGLAKLAGALLALALVRPWGARLPHRLTGLVSWSVAVLLTLYGAVLVAGDALAATGAIRPRTPVAWTPLIWHLWVWDMSFLVWGLLFGGAAWYFTRLGPTPRPRSLPASLSRRVAREDVSRRPGSAAARQ